MIARAFFALICLAAFLAFALAAAGAFTSANYPISAVFAGLAVASIVWGCIEARGCRRGF